MSHFVPDFDTDDDYLIPSSSSSSRKSTMAEEDIMELLWHNGQVVLQSQTQQRPAVKKYSPPLDLAAGTAPSPRGCPPPPPDQSLFIQEDEMASWLHYPLHEDDFCSDLLYSTAAPHPQSISRSASTTVLHPPPPPPPPQTQPERPTNQVSLSRPPVPPQRRTENEVKSVRNFANFSRFRGDRTTGGGVESGPSPSSASSSSSAVIKAVVRESVLVGSSNTAAAGTDVTRRTDGADAGWAINGAASSAASGGGASTHVANGVRVKDTTAAAASCEISGTSSSKGKAEQVHTPPATETTEIAGDRKRKGREAIEETECRSEETKQARGSTSTKRSRAAEVHNLSERKRRDRINEKMRILQELIPRCNKSDKASMLDEAIEYMKSLQLQVQMMSMGYGMTQMMYPGMQQYMQHMAMGMGMGMPFPNMLAAPSLPPMPHMGGSPAFPAPPFPVPNIHASDPSRVQAQSQQAEQALNTPHTQHPKQPLPGYLDPYQQFLGLHSIQASMLQNQATAQPSSSKQSSTSKEPKDQGNHPTG